MLRKSTVNYQANPRFHVYGKARLDVARRACTPQDWDRLWKKPIHSFPFTWDGPWKQSVEYRVDDFASEVGFFIDILGLPVLAFDTDYAMFTSPEQDFTFSVAPAMHGFTSTPPDALRLQFMIGDILETSEELMRRGVVFAQRPEPFSPGSSLYIGCFHTPHGIPVELWGFVRIAALQEDTQPDLDYEMEPQDIEDADIFIDYT